MTPASELSPTLSEPVRLVWADVLSQAVTGELIGMANYAAMAGLYDDDVVGQIDAVEHAYNERGHARAFERLAESLGVSLIVNPAAPYWRRIRQAFLTQVRAADPLACLIVQEIMLESFAVSMYDAVADVAEGRIASTFRAIAREEDGHLDHAVEELQEALRQGRDSFENKVHDLHEQVMVVLAEMLAAKDPAGHCGLCAGACVKESLHHLSLSTPELRGRALNYYLKALDRIGVRSDRSLEWVANLPA